MIVLQYFYLCPSEALNNLTTPQDLLIKHTTSSTKVKNLQIITSIQYAINKKCFYMLPEQHYVRSTMLCHPHSAIAHRGASHHPLLAQIVKPTHPTQLHVLDLR